MFLKMYGMQKKFLKKMRDKELEYEREYFNEMVLSLIVEVIELLNTTNWKSWRYNKEDRENAIEEAVDVFAFLLNICIMLKIKPKTFFSKFKEKNKDNMRRFIFIRNG